jgi:hypothetical protein
MTEKKRPNVTGKGPALSREMLEVFKEITENTSTSDKIKSGLSEKGDELGKIIKMAYLKTVKAGETAWDCKEMALELKEAIGAGDEAKAGEIYDKMIGELEQFIHKTKTFVVRMT